MKLLNRNEEVRKILIKYANWIRDDKIDNPEDKAISALNKLCDEKCKSCKEEKLNMIAEYFKRHNRNINKKEK